MAHHSHMLDIETKERMKIEYYTNFMCRWTYRIRPTVLHRPFKACDESRFENWYTVFDGEDKRLTISPMQYRWKPMEIPTDKKVTFFEGITTMGGAGGPAMKV